MGVENDIERGRQIAKRLKNELEIAQSSWAQFEAINGETELARQQFRNAKVWLRVRDQGLLSALIRDSILALCRILDDPRNDVFALSCVSKLLETEKLRTVLVEEAQNWAPQFGGGAALQETEKKCIHRKINLIRNFVPKQWNTRPKKWMIYKIREEVLWPLRGNVLAHPGETVIINGPTVNQIRYAIGRTGTLISATRHIFVGSPLDDESLKIRTKEANEFWDYAQVGFIEAFERDQRNRKSFTG